MNLPIEICAIISDYFDPIIILSKDSFKQFDTWPRWNKDIGYLTGTYKVESCFSLSPLHTIRIWIWMNISQSSHYIRLWSISSPDNFTERAVIVNFGTDLAESNIETVDKFIPAIPMLIKGSHFYKYHEPLRFVKKPLLKR